MRTPFVWVALLGLLSSSSEAWARTWTDASGKYTVEAECIDIEGDEVRLRKEDGSLLRIPISRLSKEDQVYLRQWKAPGDAAEAGSAASHAVGPKPLAKQGQIVTEPVERGGTTSAVGRAPQSGRIRTEASTAPRAASPGAASPSGPPPLPPKQRLCVVELASKKQRVLLEWLQQPVAASPDLKHVVAAGVAPEEWESLQRAPQAFHAARTQVRIQPAGGGRGRWRSLWQASQDALARPHFESFHEIRWSANGRRMLIARQLVADLKGSSWWVWPQGNRFDEANGPGRTRQEREPVEVPLPAVLPVTLINVRCEWAGASDSALVWPALDGTLKVVDFTTARWYTLCPYPPEFFEAAAAAPAPRIVSEVLAANDPSNLRKAIEESGPALRKPPAQPPAAPVAPRAPDQRAAFWRAVQESWFAVSNDCKTVAFFSYCQHSPGVWIWHAKQRKFKRVSADMVIANRSMRDAALSPDGKFAVAGVFRSDRPRFVLWVTATGEELWSHAPQGRGYNQFAFDSAGTRVCCIEDAGTLFWTPAERFQPELLVQGRNLYFPAWSSTGQEITFRVFE